MQTLIGVRYVLCSQRKHGAVIDLIGLVHQLKLQILLLLVLEFSVLVLKLDIGAGP